MYVVALVDQFTLVTNNVRDSGRADNNSSKAGCSNGGVRLVRFFCHKNLGVSEDNKQVPE